jgi:hypothetical protein
MTVVLILKMNVVLFVGTVVASRFNYIAELHSSHDRQIEYCKSRYPGTTDPPTPMSIYIYIYVAFHIFTLCRFRSITKVIRDKKILKSSTWAIFVWPIYIDVPRPYMGH